MIKAILFDLDSALVQTEKVKALSYAKAVQQIRGLLSPDLDARARIEKDWVVQDPANVTQVVLKRIHHHNQIKHQNDTDKPT